MYWTQTNSSPQTFTSTVFFRLQRVKSRFPICYHDTTKLCRSVKQNRRCKLILKKQIDFIDAAVVKVDAANDLALLSAGGRFAPLPIAASRTVKLGGTVATVGFPDIGWQGL